jgi:hypothetical protein
VPPLRHLCSALLPDNSGLLLSEFDPWGDPGLLHLPASSTPIQAEPQTLRSFIAEAYPRYGFHRWAELLIDLLQQVADGQLSRLIVTCPPRLGKLCAHDTPVPTPTGWRRHGDLRPGDLVFGPDGQPTLVLAVSEEQRATMKVTTTRGEEIWCHPGHQWQVRNRRSRRWEILETRELAALPLHSGQLGRRGSRFLFQLPLVLPLQYPRHSLPMDPYSLGYWLGNGTAGKPLVTHDRADLAPVVAMVQAGYAVSAVHHHRSPRYERGTGHLTGGVVHPQGTPQPSAT